jgi:uncharacterized protein YecE (DUF72 family)
MNRSGSVKWRAGGRGVVENCFRRSNGRLWCADVLDPSAKLKIGTCAWSFEDWRGSFYPEHLPPAERLAFYARHFDSVEVDSTFYSAPTPQVAQHWAERTPPEFVFTCKLPREITHDRKLRDSQELVHEFLRAIEPLRSKLGCVLVQLPPFFQIRQDEAALRGFVESLPREVRWAIEFRHDGWHLPRIVHLLESHRICWVWNDVTPLDHQEEGAFEFLPTTTDFAYVRLMGDLKTKPRRDEVRASQRYDRLAWPRDSSLESWSVRLRQCIEEFSRVYVYANNHFEGFSPLTSQRLAVRLGVPVRTFAEPAADEPVSAQLELL